MKLLRLFLISFLIPKAFAYDAVVIVLEAPLLKEPRMSSTVLQTLRKGARVYVPNEIGQGNDLPAFVQTYDRVGNVAFIPAKYIKLITNDVSEYKTPVSLPHDPTDYRLEEPIPSTYPFDDTSFLRASIFASFAPNINSSYAYNSSYHQQNFTSEMGLKLNVTKKVSFDRWDRYYFGITTAINTSGNTIQFDNGSHSKESSALIKLGPVLTYDAYKTQRYRLTLGTGFTYNYHKRAIKMVAEQGTEERLFTGFSMSPFANMIAQVMEVFPNTDLLAGADINFNMAHTLKTSDQLTIPEIWSAEAPDQIKSSFKPQAAFLLGVQVRY